MSRNELIIILKVFRSGKARFWPMRNISVNSDQILRYSELNVSYSGPFTMCSPEAAGGCSCLLSSFKYWTSVSPWLDLLQTGHVASWLIELVAGNKFVSYWADCDWTPIWFIFVVKVGQTTSIFLSMTIEPSSSFSSPINTPTLP